MTTYRSLARTCRWCRLRIVYAGAGDYCDGCRPLRDIVLTGLSAIRASALELLLADPEPAESTGARERRPPSRGAGGPPSASPSTPPSPHEGATP